MGEPETVAPATGVGMRDGAMLDGATAAWALALPLAALAVALIALLARPFGRLVYPHMRAAELFPWAFHFYRPEPAEQGMYVLALAVPVVLSAAVLLARPRAFAPRPGTAGLLALAARAALAVAVLAALLGQYRIRYDWTQAATPAYRFFTPATLVVAAVAAGGLATLLRSGAVRGRLQAAMGDTAVRRRAALALVAAFTAVWMLNAIQTDRSVAWAPAATLAHLPYTSAEIFAVVNGLTPFVDFNAAYATLWPYVVAIPLVAFGKTMLVFTLTTSAITAAALAAGYGILRRAVGTPVGALLLYLPFLATSLYGLVGHAPNRFTAATYLADFPLRYAGPLLLAWLTARALDGPQPRAPWTLFAAGGLVALNNVGVGLPALGATLLVCAALRPLTRSALFELGRAAAAGVAVAVAAVTLLTLARSGSLPRFGQLSEFSRFYLAGYSATPLHSVLGVHLALYLTFAAAIVTAAVRLRRRARGAVMTGMLLWNGAFGLATLSYFVAESGPTWLLASFSTWALTLMLLAALAVRRAARSTGRRPDLAELTVLFGVGLMACSLAQTPAPWSQIARLTGHHGGVPRTSTTFVPFVPDQGARAFVASVPYGGGFYLKRGAPVAFLFENGHRVADGYGVRNVSPYANAPEMFARTSLVSVVEALRRAGGNTIVLALSAESGPDLDSALAGMGFGVVTKDGIAPVAGRQVQPLTRSVHGESLVKWVDLRDLRPPALRHDRGRLVGPARVLSR
jgi:hypothetical protein